MYVRGELMWCFISAATQSSASPSFSWEFIVSDNKRERREIHHRGKMKDVIRNE